MCLKNYGQRSVILYRSSDKTVPKKKKSKKAKWLSEEALQIAEERREAKSKVEVYPTKHRFPKNSMEGQEDLLQ